MYWGKEPSFKFKKNDEFIKGFEEVWKYFNKKGSSTTTKKPSTSASTSSTSTSSAVKQFFPLWGFTLGQTTWKQAEALGAEVRTSGPKGGKVADLHDVSFWDYDNTGRFTSIFWTHSDADFPSSWKAKGFSWDNSYNTWLSTFKKMGYSIKIEESPTTEIYKGRKTLSAKFTATSPDGTLCFALTFGYGEHGHYTSSPNTLFYMDIEYQ